MIQAKGIEKSFGSLKVLKGVGFDVKKSEVVAIMGASGAGKSTLLQILGTLSTPDEGTLMIDGTDVLSLSGKGLSEFRNRRLGFVFQFHHLLPEFTALENVMIPAFIAGRSKSDAESSARELLGELGLSERLAHKPSELSGGEQQRVAIARALINRPAVLFADEPSGAPVLCVSGCRHRKALRGVSPQGWQLRSDYRGINKRRPARSHIRPGRIAAGAFCHSGIVNET